VWPDIARTAAVVIAVILLVSQVRKPGRWIGRPFVWMMNVTHAPLTTWGLEHVTIGKQFEILDVGCGGGATVSRLAAMASDGRVYGVDYADGSVAVSRRKNAELIAAGRVDIRKASVSQLPFDAGTFDLVTAIETHYYWPDLAASMLEIRRVLKSGGTLMILAESYRGSRFDALQRVVMNPLKSAHLSVDEHRELFTTAGYSDVRVSEQRGRGWICVTGRVPDLMTRQDAPELVRPSSR
jgi:SAM-dependent methyltransferase